jgi:hypothetical protein
MRAFREAVEAQDFDRINDLLSDSVVFTSPVAHTPYPGKPITAAILRGVFRVFEDFHYVWEMEGGSNSGLVFKATVNGLELTGCDFIHLDAEGRIDDFMVMVRPLSAAKALADRMAAQFDDIKRQAGASAAQ